MTDTAESWTLYYITFGTGLVPAYVGITTQPEKRLDWHIDDSRRAPGLHQSAITRRIQAEAVHGRKPHLKVLADGLDREQAKEAEVKTIRGLLRAGIALENTYLLGPVVNRHPVGSPEYLQANRTSANERYANDPAYREAQKTKSRVRRQQDRATSEGPARVTGHDAILAERGEQWPQ